MYDYSRTVITKDNWLDVQRRDCTVNGGRWVLNTMNGGVANKGSDLVYNQLYLKIITSDRRRRDEGIDHQWED